MLLGAPLPTSHIDLIWLHGVGAQSPVSRIKNGQQSKFLAQPDLPPMLGQSHAPLTVWSSTFANKPSHSLTLFKVCAKPRFSAS